MIRKVVNFLLDVLYPRFCFGCGRPGEFLCDRCYSRLNFVLDDDLRPALFGDGRECHLSRIQAAVTYDTLLAKMLHHYKYLGCRDLSDTFAYWLWEFVDWGEADMITYIPIHRRRWRERGYNQAKLIAEQLARLSGLPCRPLLVRQVHKDNQAHSKSKAERLEKTKGIFALRADSDQMAAGKRILLIDDVVTSGATLNEAARVLRGLPGVQVQALAVAHGD